MFELLEVVIKTVVGHQNERKTQEKKPQIRTWSISTKYTVEGDRLHAFFTYSILYYSVTIKFLKKVCQNLFAD